MKTLLYFLIAIMFISCNSDDDVSTAPAVQTGPVAFTEIHKFYLGGSGSEGIVASNLVIDNVTDWNSLINQMNSYNTLSPLFNQTSVDFNQNMVIAVFRDVMPIIQFVEITEVMENANDITVTIEDTNFVNGFTQISQPYHIIVIPKTNKPFVFQ